jgi:predicted dehydrogenase
VKLLVAGGGAFGEEHLRTLGALELAVAEPRTEVRERLVGRYALADSDGDTATLIERFAPSGVVVATPAAAHEGITLDALARGLPVLVEKPVAPDPATARRLRDAAASSRGFLQPGHILRFSAPHRQLAGILRSGEIGDLVHVGSRRYRDAAHADRYPDVDPVLMTMIHDIDLALWFDGRVPVSARANRGPPGSGRSMTDAWLTGAAGTSWHLSTAWLHPGPAVPDDRVELVGTRGSAELHVGSHIEVFAGESRRIPADAADDPLRTELLCFLDGIRSGTSRAPVTPDDAVDGLVVATMILAALDGR